MHDAIEVPSRVGMLTMRPERDEDQAFRYQLFCASRQPEFALLFPPDVFQQVMLQQFHAQTVSYREQFPQARFDIVEMAGRPIGRIVVDRPGAMIHIVDQAIIPEQRNRGIGTALMQALMEEARREKLPLRLEVASSNDPSLRLYSRLGFVEIETVPLYMQLEWRPPSDATDGR